MENFDLRKFLTENKLTETSKRLNEDAGDLMKLVGKTQDDDLTTSDAKTIGKKVADMSGDELQSYLGMIKALGGYYGGKGKGKETLDKLRKTMMDAYNKAKGE